LKEAYAAEFAATIERAEKQIILARHGRRLLNLLDDTPIIPGSVRNSYEHTNQARQILNDAEDDLKDWQPDLEDVPSSAHLGSNLMPLTSRRPQNLDESVAGGSVIGEENVVTGAEYTHDRLAGDQSVDGGTSTVTGDAYAPSSVATGTVDGYASSEPGTTQHIAA
jgi:hypothetical protein